MAVNLSMSAGSCPTSSYAMSVLRVFKSSRRIHSFKRKRGCEVCSSLAGTMLQVTTEGGYDAAMEAPYIYAAVDALAVRAGKWAERRQRLLLEASPDDLAVPTPEAAAAAAIAAVKEVRLHAFEFPCLKKDNCQHNTESLSFVLLPTS